MGGQLFLLSGGSLVLFAPGEPTPGAEVLAQGLSSATVALSRHLNSQNRLKDAKLLLVQLSALDNNGRDRLLAGRNRANTIRILASVLPFLHSLVSVVVVDSIP